MMGFTVVPDYSDYRRFTDTSSRTSYIWPSAQIDHVNSRQLTTLFINRLTILTNQLRQAIEDLEIPMAPKNQQQFMDRSLDSRHTLFRNTGEKLIRGQLFRNAQIRRTIDDYERVYNEKFRCKDTIEIVATVETQEITKNDTQQANYVRPRSHSFNQRFSRSLVIERRVKPKQDMTIVGNPSIFQCKGQMLSSKSRNAVKPKVCTNIRHGAGLTTKAEETEQKTSIEQTTPTYADFPLLHLEQPERQRFSFIDENRRQFAPAFAYRASSMYTSNSSNSTTNKMTEIDVLKDRIRLLNCQFAIKLSKNQGYKRKLRNPRNLSSILV